MAQNRLRMCYGQLKRKTCALTTVVVQGTHYLRQLTSMTIETTSVKRSHSAIAQPWTALLGSANSAMFADGGCRQEKPVYARALSGGLTS